LTDGQSKQFSLDQQPPITITESVGDGQWRLTKVICTGGKKNYTVDYATGTLTLGPTIGDDIKCIFWNELPRMTGGGFIGQVAETAALQNPSGGVSGPKAGDKVTHGFELYCGVAAKKRANNLEVNWGGFAFHLDTLTTAFCDGNATTPDPTLAALNPEMPNSPFNRYTGTGTGSINKGKPDSYYARWQLVDNGEPGTSDRWALAIWNVADFNSKTALCVTSTASCSGTGNSKIPNANVDLSSVKPIVLFGQFGSGPATDLRMGATVDSNRKAFYGNATTGTTPVFGGVVLGIPAGAGGGGNHQAH